MKTVSLAPEAPYLQVYYIGCKAKPQSNGAEAVEKWSQLIFDLSTTGDIDISTALNETQIEKFITDSPVPFLFPLDKIVSWRLVQAAILSALDSTLSQQKKVKTLKADVLYRLAPGWSVKDIRAKLEPRVEDSLLICWLCSSKLSTSEVLRLVEEKFHAHGFELERQDTLDFESHRSSLQKQYGVTDAEMQLSGGIEVAILQKCAIKDI